MKEVIETKEDRKFIKDAIRDLKNYKRIYVYKDYILEELKMMFSDLNIRKWDFYWEVTR